MPALELDREEMIRVENGVSRETVMTRARMTCECRSKARAWSTLTVRLRGTLAMIAPWCGRDRATLPTSAIGTFKIAFLSYLPMSIYCN